MSDSENDEEFDKNGLYIVIDKRERAIIPFFKQLQSNAGIPYFVEHMTTGDIAICYRSYILIIIERKTWADLGSSIKDGRKSNIEKLKRLRTDTECQVAYLIEGNPCPNPTTKYARIPQKNLRSHLDHLAFRDGVHMIYAKSCNDTARRVFELTKNYGTITPSPLKKIDKLLDGDEPKTGGEEKLRTKHESSDELILFKMWCSFPYITEKTANLFVTGGYKLKDLILDNIPKKNIAVMKYASGTLIGTKRAANMIKFAKLQKTQVKIMSEIPSVTAKTAKLILEKFSIEELLEITEVDKISKIQKTEKAKIGVASAKKIIKFLTM
jgi:ERCC4-type nuclease